MKLTKKQAKAERARKLKAERDRWAAQWVRHCELVESAEGILQEAQQAANKFLEFKQDADKALRRAQREVSGG